jgi:sortase A
MTFLFHSERIRRNLRPAQYGLAVVGIVGLGYCLAVYLAGKLFEAREALKLSAELRQKSAEIEAARPASPETPPGEGAVVGRLESPRVGLSVMVVEGVEAGDLRKAAGHIPGTALPGRPGNVGIAGHRDTFFRPLRNVQAGDTMILTTLKGESRYRVTSTAVVEPRDIQVLYPTRVDSLTLVTCFPFDYIGPAPKRFIVKAQQLSEPRPSGSGLAPVDNDSPTD